MRKIPIIQVYTLPLIPHILNIKSAVYMPLNIIMKWGY